MASLTDAETETIELLITCAGAATEEAIYKAYNHIIYSSYILAYFNGKAYGFILKEE